MIKVIKTIETDRQLVTEPTIFVSDWHMEDGEKGDKFLSHTRAAIDFLQHVRSEKWSLFCLGDMFDLWQARPDVIADFYHGLVFLFQEIGHRRVSWVLGNHDYAIRHHFFMDACESIVSEHVYATHGHQADTFNHGWWGRLVGKVATKFAQWLADDVGVDLFKQKEMQKWGNSPSKRTEEVDWRTSDYCVYILGKLQEHGCTVGIYGHTHCADLFEATYIDKGEVKTVDAKKWVIANCGSWTGKNRPLIKIEENKVMLCEWE